MTTTEAMTAYMTRRGLDLVPAATIPNMEGRRRTRLRRQRMPTYFSMVRLYWWPGCNCLYRLYESEKVCTVQSTGLFSTAQWTNTSLYRYSRSDSYYFPATSMIHLPPAIIMKL